jgi:hypothetical protein
MRPRRWTRALSQQFPQDMRRMTSAAAGDARRDRPTSQPGDREGALISRPISQATAQNSSGSRWQE